LATVGAVIALAAILILLVATSRSLPGEAADSRDTPAALAHSPTALPGTAATQSQAEIQPSVSTDSNRSTQAGVALQPSSQAPPVDPVVAMRLSIQRQVDTGHLNPDKAADLYKKVDEIARAMNEGNTAEATKKVKELRDRLTSLLNEGQLSGAGHATLIRDLDSIAAALP
jgi:serine/threonine-protein kinase